MGEKADELMLNRLLVLVQIIAIPVYFIYFNIMWHDSIKTFFDNNQFIQTTFPDWLIWFEINLALPIFFSLPWVLISIIRATRISDSYTLMGRALGKVRIDQKLFYGINATFTLVFLVLPFASPIITIIGVFVLMRILSHKLVIGKFSKLIWFIPALIISIFPTLIAIAFYSNYNTLFEKIFIIWKDSIDTVFGVGLSLAIAISFGNFIAFLFERNIRNTGKKTDPYRLIYVFKFILFGFFLFIFFNFHIEVLNTINIIAAIFVGMEFIFRRLSKLPSEGGGANIMVFAFIIINMMTKSIQKVISVDLFKAFIIVLSGFVFFILFLISYKYAEDEELITRN